MSFDNRDLKSKLDEMEAEIKRETVIDPEDTTSQSVFPEVEINPSSQIQEWIDSGKAWFATLPQVGKAAVAIGGVWLGFSVASALLHVVSSILSIAFVGFLVFVGYRLFTNDSGSN